VTVAFPNVTRRTISNGFLHQSAGIASSGVVLRHLRSRHGETKDVVLTFDGKRQRFTPAEPAESKTRADRGKLQAALRALWDRTSPAQDDGASD
jgi:hypothetical protein